MFSGGTGLTKHRRMKRQGNLSCCLVHTLKQQSEPSLLQRQCFRLMSISTPARYLYPWTTLEYKRVQPSSRSLVPEPMLHLCSNPHLWSQIWVLTQRMRSWTQAAEMSLLQRGAGLSLRDRGRSSTMRGEELHHPDGAGNKAAAPPHRKDSAKVVHLVRMPPGRRPRVRTRTRWRDYISHLVWEHLGIPQEELESVAGLMSGFPSWTCWLCNLDGCQGLWSRYVM